MFFFPILLGYNRCPVSPLGRPRLDTDVDEILELRRLNFSWTKIASVVGISRSTLYRRLEEAGINPNDRAPVCEELDSKIRSIKVDHPNDGEVLIQGHLVRMGIRVARNALRASIHRVDHDGAVERQLHVVRRRVYSVPHPNAMWHIDGHHKLIRWRFVIHAAIDGFSRTIIYAKCADNNRARTVLQYFSYGVTQFGLPDKVRSDHGGENVGVWRFMIANHNRDNTCVITGSSVHNERIERLWHDVHRCVVSPFSDTFRLLESSETLDPSNEVDLYCLHYIFLPRILKNLSEFQESWNNHTLSSEGSKTPYELFFEGLSHTIAFNGYSVGAMDFAGDHDLSEMTADRVCVPRISFVPCSVFSQAVSVIDPLQVCSDNGKCLYDHMIEIAGRHLSTCSQCTQI